MHDEEPSQTGTEPLPVQRVCAQVLADRYAAPGERSTQQIYTRVAHALAQAEQPARQPEFARLFLDNMAAGAIGAGRIMANAGIDACTTMVNCFVQPIGGGTPALPFDAGLAQAGTTLAMGGGVGYDFSPLPPAAACADARSAAPAVCQAIDLYDQACLNIRWQGSRRGAQMAVLSCSHPDILEFVRAKRGRQRWSTFNVSVAVTDAFFAAVQCNASWALVHTAPPDPEGASKEAVRLDDGLWRYQVLPARALWREICEQALRSAEPGLLYIDTINRANNLRALETLRATNPCGEQPLPDHGSCVLGPINLTRVVTHPFGVEGAPGLDLEALARMARTQVRMLDNVIDLTRWPLSSQADEARAKRRIGVGVTGLADMLIMMGLRYDSDPGRAAAQTVLRCIRDHAYAASAELARERGAFPLYRPADYLAEDAACRQLPDDVRRAIAAHGLRNSHLVSLAPTGSVSLAFADNCSNGVEPAHGWTYRRRLQLRGQPAEDARVENHAWRLWRRLHPQPAPLPDYFRAARDIAPEDHVAMVASLQPTWTHRYRRRFPSPATGRWNGSRPCSCRDGGPA